MKIFRRFVRVLEFAGVLVGLVALLLMVQSPRFRVLAAIQPEKITLTVAVKDQLDRYVSGLQKEHFQIWEDRIEQEITGLDNDVHADVSFVIAVNGATQDPAPGRVLDGLTAVRQPGDEFEFVRLDAGTGPMDGLRTAIERSRSLRNARRGIVIVSLGSDTPAYSPEETKAAAASSDVPIYAVSTWANTTAKPLFDDLARFTGGQHYQINDASDLDQPMIRIAVAIRNSYLLTYDSANTARDGKYRRIRVKVNPPRGIQHLNTSLRDGYVAPKP